MKLQKLMVVLLVIAFAGTASAATDAVTGAIDVMTHATASDLDTSFGTNGTVSTSLGDGLTLELQGMDMCVQPDGKIIVVGGVAKLDRTDKHFALARYNPDGSLDTSFKSASGGAPEDVSSPDGIVITNFTTSTNAYAARCAVGPDGVIVVVGTYVNSSGKKRFAIAKYGSDGSRDTNFSENGLERLAVGGSSSHSEARDVAISRDGKIWIAGYWENSDSPNQRRIAVTRFVTSGCPEGVSACLDSTFGRQDGGGNGNDGTSISSPLDSTREEAFAIAVHADGKAVVGGLARVGGKDKFLIARYTAGGCAEGHCLDGVGFSLNPFGSVGYIISDLDNGFNEDIYSIILQEDGKIVVAGDFVLEGDSKFLVRRYKTSGVDDEAFGNGGAVHIDFDLDASALGLAVYDGKLVVAGLETDSAFNLQTAIAALNTDSGLPDETFAPGGHFVSPYPKGSFGVTIQADGKIVTAGLNGENPLGFGLARFMGYYTPPAPPAASADLGITMAAVQAEGQAATNELTYNVTVSNAGPNGAEAIVAKITLPANVTFVSASEGCVGTTEITCDMGTMAKDESKTIEFKVTGSTESDMSYTAVVTSSTPDPSEANNTAQLTTAKLSSSGPEPPLVGMDDAGGCGCMIRNGAGHPPHALLVLMWAIITAPVVGVRIWKGREP